MDGTNGQSRRRFLRDLVGSVARIGSGGLITLHAPPSAEAVVQVTVASGPSRPDPGVSEELLADMNDLSGILEP